MGRRRLLNAEVEDVNMASSYTHQATALTMLPCEQDAVSQEHHHRDRESRDRRRREARDSRDVDAR